MPPPPHNSGKISNFLQKVTQEILRRLLRFLLNHQGLESKPQRSIAPQTSATLLW